MFSARTHSTISIPGPSSRVSPTQEPPGFEDFDFSPWMEMKREPQSGSSKTGGCVNELLDKTDHLRLECGVGPNVSSESGLRTGNLIKSVNGNFLFFFEISVRKVIKFRFKKTLLIYFLIYDYKQCEDLK